MRYFVQDVHENSSHGASALHTIALHPKFAESHGVLYLLDLFFDARSVGLSSVEVSLGNILKTTLSASEENRKALVRIVEDPEILIRLFPGLRLQDISKKKASTFSIGCISAEDVQLEDESEREEKEDSVQDFIRWIYAAERSAKLEAITSRVKRLLGPIITAQQKAVEKLSLKRNRNFRHRVDKASKEAQATGRVVDETEQKVKIVLCSITEQQTNRLLACERARAFRANEGANAWAAMQYDCSILSLLTRKSGVNSVPENANASGETNSTTVKDTRSDKPYHFQNSTESISDLEFKQNTSEAKSVDLYKSWNSGDTSGEERTVEEDKTQTNASNAEYCVQQTLESPKVKQKRRRRRMRASASWASLSPAEKDEEANKHNQIPNVDSHISAEESVLLPAYPRKDRQVETEDNPNLSLEMDLSRINGKNHTHESMKLHQDDFDKQLQHSKVSGVASDYTTSDIPFEWASKTENLMCSASVGHSSSHALSTSPPSRLSSLLSSRKDSRGKMVGSLRDSKENVDYIRSHALSEDHAPRLDLSRFQTLEPVHKTGEEIN